MIVLVSGIALGCFLWRTYLDGVPRLYPPEFTRGQWLVAVDDAPQGYFRHELYISEPFQQAWVTIVGTDSFILYLNGRVVDAKGYASLNVSGVYDVGPYLVPGKNVIGLVARRLSYPGPAMAALEGVYRDRSGREHIFATDTTWKFSPVEQLQGGGEIPWYAETFDATAWQSATTKGRPQASEVYPLIVPPLIFAMPPQGQWIGQDGVAPGQATFSYTFPLPDQVEDAWMRIAANGPYALAINGIVIDRGEMPRDVEMLRLLRLQGAVLWSNQDSLATDLYRIAPYLRQGVNHLSVSLGESFPAPSGLFVDGFLLSRGETLPFGSDAAWTVTAPSLMPAPSSGQHHAIVLAEAVPEHDVLPVKQTVIAIQPLSYTIKQFLVLALVLLLTTGPMYLLWKSSVRLLQALRRDTPMEAGRRAALPHLASALILGSVYLLSFDVRLDPAFPFQSWVIGLSVAAIFLCKTLVLLEAWYHRQPQRHHGPSAQLCHDVAARTGTIIVLIVFIAAGSFLRVRNLDGQSLYHDEVHMVTYVKGLLEQGYPHKMIGPIERPLSTYELTPYPIALSVLLLGLSDFALRLPAALFGILTIPLLYFVGRQVFDRRVGLLAAAVYTFCPQAVIWAQYLWHPQQTQFFALLTSYLCYQAIRSTPLAPRYLYLSALVLVITYLSWEGSGFFLPALGFGVAVVKGKDLSWLREKRLWIAVGLVSLVVGGQLIRRLLLQVSYLVIGQGLSDVSLPTLYFLDPMYEPTFYLKNFLWLENNVLLTLLVVGTLPALFRHPGFAYYCMLLFSVTFLMTNTLPNAAIRYVYYLQPFLILSASAALFFILDYAFGLGRDRHLQASRWLKCTMAIALCVMVSLGSSLFMKFYRLSHFAYPNGVHTRTGVYYIDYRTSAQYVNARYQPGDLVIAIVADTLTHYSDLESSYFIQVYTMRQVFYDPSEASPRYLERIVGNPVIRDFDDLKDALSRYQRAWVIATPESIFMRMAGLDIRQYFSKMGGVVYESYNSKVYLLHH
jgi:4-amino-4-deoxy-L-arabinose transferase-like glycosyltransferase